MYMKKKRDVTVPHLTTEQNFGDVMKNKEAVKFKGHMVGVTGVIYWQLQIMEKEESYFYSTSMNSTLPKKSMKRVNDNKSLHSVLKCSNCTIIWNRDANTSRNMYIDAFVSFNAT
ncbi:hypothetical protein BD770DRAFT_414396 [Pilaira anomala]|nr:hypothetical protein BD770DRAFT_414396 [Pilaira anomala]